MITTKERLAEALSEFISNDIANDLKDASVRAMAMAIAKVMQRKPEAFDKIFDNRLVSMFLGKENDNQYDLSLAEETLKEMCCNGNILYLTIPSIPLLHPDETRIGLSYNDIEKLFSRI